MSNNELETIRMAISATRRRILDLVESAYGETPKFPFVRSRLLGLFGRDGLEGAIQQLNLNQRTGADHAERLQEPSR